MRTIADHILDIAQNSITAKATLIEIIVEENKNQNLYTLVIRDNGVGMEKEIASQAEKPFFTTRTTRKIGLGLPLLKQNAEQAGGAFYLKSTPGKGTEIKAVFKHNHLDRPPLGDIADTFNLLLFSEENIEFIYTHSTNIGTYSIKGSEIRDTLIGVTLRSRIIREAIKDLINNNLKDLRIT